jgi:proline iminopeptidase
VAAGKKEAWLHKEREDFKVTVSRKRYSRRKGAPLAPVKTGGIRLIPVAGKYKVWTKRVGAGRIKVLTLHGGPGATVFLPHRQAGQPALRLAGLPAYGAKKSHEYFECFEDFLPQQGIEFYYYDQLGSYYSDQPDDPKLWIGV